MTLVLFERAVLLRDFPDAGLRKEDVGTIAERYRDESGAVKGYELEFFSAAGDTLAVESVAADAVREPTSADHLAVRAG